MKNMLMTCAFLMAALGIGGVCSGAVLLDDTFADASRTETDLPNESAVWVSHPLRVTMDTGSLAFEQDGSSSKMWTYFAPDGSPATLDVGDKLIATIEFTPRGGMTSTTSRNFRFGIFNDPTDGQVLEDINSDGGGTGNPWTDSRGYAVQFTLSPDSTAGTIQVGKRTSLTNTSLLGSSGAFTWSSGAGQANNLSLDTVYTLTLTLERLAVDQMQVTFAFSDSGGVIATNSLLDDGLASLPIYTAFDQLFFRMNNTTGTANVLDYHSIGVEHIVPEDPGPPVGIPHTFSAFESCRTESALPGTNRQDSSKLSVRGEDGPAKSWIKFNIGEPNGLVVRAAFLTVTLIEDRSGTVDVSGVNDNCLDNFFWTSSELTWNDAPANDTASFGGLDANKATLLGTLTVGGGIGSSHSVDVTEIIEADTDGIVQFVLHNSSALINFGTHNHANTAYRPVLTIIEAPAGADYPNPYPGKVVETTLAELTWTNPDPNDVGGSIFCDVYLGTDPNRAAMDKVSLGADASSVAINTANFPNFGVLQNKTTYYWVVDCFDSSTGGGPIPGLMWSFVTDDNMPPVVYAGADQVVWLGMVVEGEVTATLFGETSDDGLPNPPGAYTVEWTQVTTGAATVTIDDADQDVATVTFTERGTYTFQLTGDDGDKQASDTVVIYVGADACDASHLSTGAPYLPGDINQDCIVDLEDFALLISESWLNCTDTLTHCGM